MTDIRNNLTATERDGRDFASQKTNRGEIGDVRSLQRKLRSIASYYKEIPLIQADGIFGSSTEDALLKFQGMFGLERTGIADFDTWNKIVEISKDTDRATEPTNPVLIFGEANVPVLPGDKDNQLFVIQAMMLALAQENESITAPSVTGIHDKNSVDAVKSVQLITGLDDNGIIDARFSENLGQLYEVYITRERVKNSK